MPVNPPRLATWLLSTLGTGRDVEVIAGDLREQYRDRSRVWYWRQVGYAICLGAMQHLRRHWVLTLRAIWVGGAAMGIASFALRRVAYWSLPAVLPAPISPSSVPVLLLTIGLPAVVAGWVVGRLHRPHGAAFAISLAIVVPLVLLLPRLVFLIRNSFEHERFQPYLWAHLTNMPLLAALVVSGLLLGTILAQSTNQDARRATL
jgi:hypothetical protein